MSSKPNGSLTVAELGEDAVLAAILPLLPSSSSVTIGPGDDAAGIRGDGLTLLTTDTMVAGRDFSLDWSSPTDLGRKAVASNFADVAAMGALPGALLVALTLPPNTTLDWVQAFASGIATAISRLNPGAAVIGGDLALGDQLQIAVTAVGWLAEGQAVLRSGARSGHTVALAGRQGESAAGLQLLDNGFRAGDPANGKHSSVTALIQAQLSPEPPIMLGVSARLAGASAMLDISDGLVRDAGRIAKASKVAIDLSSAQLERFVHPLLQAAKLLERNPIQALELARNWVYQGGEDHCLLATFPSEVSIPQGFEVIGKVTNSKRSAVLLDGEPIAPAGWDSLRQV